MSLEGWCPVDRSEPGPRREGTSTQTGHHLAAGLQQHTSLATVLSGRSGAHQCFEISNASSFGVAHGPPCHPDSSANAHGPPCHPDSSAKTATRSHDAPRPRPVAQDLALALERVPGGGKVHRPRTSSSNNERAGGGGMFWERKLTLVATRFPRRCPPPPPSLVCLQRCRCRRAQGRRSAFGPTLRAPFRSLRSSRIGPVHVPPADPPFERADVRV